VFLSIATSFMLLCAVLYAFVFGKLPIVKYYRSKAASEGSKTVAADLVAAGMEMQQTGIVFYLLLICNQFLHGRPQCLWFRVFVIGLCTKWSYCSSVLFQDQLPILLKV
ncbi:hypothetical protein MKX01_023469, partial [Papaver californicum]